MKKLEQGNIIGVFFKGNEYVRFIGHCFANVLISGVHVKIINVMKQEYILLLTIASPGIDRIHKAIEEYGGEQIL